MSSMFQNIEEAQIGVNHALRGNKSDLQLMRQGRTRVEKVDCESWDHTTRNGELSHLCQNVHSTSCA
jgi:hypothetical protein